MCPLRRQITHFLRKFTKQFRVVFLLTSRANCILHAEPGPQSEGGRTARFSWSECRGSILHNHLVRFGTAVHDTLYVASSSTERDLVVANSDGSNVDPNQPSELVECLATGAFVCQMSADPNNGGSFRVGINNIGWVTFRLAAVDDNANAMKIWSSVVA